MYSWILLFGDVETDIWGLSGMAKVPKINVSIIGNDSKEPDIMASIGQLSVRLRRLSFNEDGALPFQEHCPFGSIASGLRAGSPFRISRMTLGDLLSQKLSRGVRRFSG